jgi:cytoskeleton protein RodZ
MTMAMELASGGFDGYLIFSQKAVLNEWYQPGSILRHARESKGLAIADVSHHTRIPVRVIEALEADDYGVFSSPTYARSFLSQYAEFVDVDATRWLDHFEPAAITGGDDEWGVLDIPEPPRRASRSPVAAIETPNRSHGAGATMLLILVTGGLTYGGWKVWPHLDQKFGSLEPPAAPVQATPPASDGEPQGAPKTEIVSAPDLKAAPEGPPPRAIIIQEAAQ